MDYTNRLDQIVFLKDADIVNDMSAQTISGNAVTANGVPSYDLFKTHYNEVSSNVNFLSSTLSVAVRRDLSAVRYFGTVQLSDRYEYEGIAELTGNTLFGLLKSNMYIKDPNKELIAGFMFRAVGDEDKIFTVSSDNATKAKLLRSNDYLTINKNIAHLSDVSIVDIDVIKDYDLSVRALEKYALDNIKQLSSQLSTTVEVKTIESTSTETIENIAASIKSHWNIGDIIIVKRRLGTDDSVKNLFEHTGYVYDGTNWKAMDGNYTANNVYLKDDLILAGDYTLGNVKQATATLYTVNKGTSVADALTEIFTKEKEPTTVTGASITLEMVTTAADEVGTTVKPKYKVTFSPGSFSYGSINSSGLWVNGTGITSTKLTLKNTIDSSPIDANSGQTYTAATTIQYTDTQEYEVTANGEWSASNKPATNTHKASKTKEAFPAGSDVKTAKLVAGYRCMFAGSYTTAQPINSATIRAFASTKVKAQTCTAESTKSKGTFNAKIVEGAMQVLIAVPSNYKVTLVKDKNAFGQDVFSSFSALEPVDVQGNNGYTAKQYNVYEYKPKAALEEDEYGITVAVA